MIGRLARILHDVSGARLIVLLTLMLLAALAETIGLLSIIPMLFAALGDGGDGKMSDVITAIGFTPTLEVMLVIFLLAFALRIALGLARDRMAAQLDAQLEAVIGERAARNLAALPFAEVAARGRGDIQSLLGFDVPRASAAANLLIQLMSQFMLLLVAGAVAFALSPPLSLIAVVTALLILLAAAPRWRGSHEDGDRISALHAEQDAMAQQMFGALKAAKAQGSGDALAREYGSRLGAVAQAQAGLDMRQAGTRAIVLGLSAITIAAMILLGARSFGLGLTTLGTLLLLFARLVGPVQAIHRMADQLAGLLPAFARVEPLLSHREMQAPLAAQHFQRLEAQDLSLSHGGEPLFDSLSFAVARGEWLALLGASGAGKTGLIDLIAGLQSPTAGQILVDGRPPADSWPAAIAYVPQADLVFHDSIAANLSLGSAPDAETMREALALVGLDRRLDERVSEIGGALSGGERQRLLIARALCRRPQYLLLDEAFSALDEQSVSLIIGNIRRAAPDMGAILITHRAGIAALCDQRIALGFASANS